MILPFKALFKKDIFFRVNQFKMKASETGLSFDLKYHYIDRWGQVQPFLAKPGQATPVMTWGHDQKRSLEKKQALEEIEILKSDKCGSRNLAAGTDTAASYNANECSNCNGLFLYKFEKKEGVCRFCLAADSHESVSQVLKKFGRAKLGR